MKARARQTLSPSLSPVAATARLLWATIPPTPLSWIFEVNPSITSPVIAAIAFIAAWMTLTGAMSSSLGRRGSFLPSTCLGEMRMDLLFLLAFGHWQPDTLKVPRLDSFVNLLRDPGFISVSSPPLQLRQILSNYMYTHTLRFVTDTFKMLLKNKKLNKANKTKKRV